MIKKILLTLLLLILLFVAFVATRPADYRVSRTATLDAPVAAVFARVNDFHKWNDWSPWAKLDPKCKTEFFGPESGAGAKMMWDGDAEVGAGSLTITESVPGEKIAMDLHFIKPFEGKSMSEFTFKPIGEKTEVTWAMSGENGFIGKCLSLVCDCEKMIGEQYDKGLSALGEVAKADADK